jgi:probable selenium-dependent hydroxylase accessory protein YqeC
VPVPSQYLERGEIVAPVPQLLGEVTAALRRSRHIAFSQPIDKPGRHGALPLDLIGTIHEKAGFDVTFVKADGARMRWIRAPDGHEPQIPPGTVTVIPVVSARVIGHSLSAKIAHRPERGASVTGANIGDILTPAHLARLLASPEGALRGVGDATFIPVINMVDDAELHAAASEAARQTLALTARFRRVVLTRMIAEDPVVAVIGDHATVHARAAKHLH